MMGKKKAQDESDTEAPALLLLNWPVTLHNPIYWYKKKLSDEVMGAQFNSAGKKPLWISMYE